MLSSYTGVLCTLDLINLGIELETVTANSNRDCGTVTWPKERAVICMPREGVLNLKLLPPCLNLEKYEHVTHVTLSSSID